MNPHCRASLRCCLLALCASCSDNSEESEELPLSTTDVPAPFNPDVAYAPDVTPAELDADVDNPLFPAPLGARWVYSGNTEDGVERTEVVVQPDPRAVWGAMARVVRDTVSLEGEMVEDTMDWYSQDTDGNVWYMGEDTAEYENGVVVSTSGAWESGVSAALPGVIMLASPRVGDVYRQEYLPGEAEDLASVVSLDETVTVPAGTFTGCLKTRERSALDPDVDEFKYYCPGIGNVLVEEEDVREELIEYSGL